MRAGPRKQAKLEGKTRYFTGIPCKFGHVAERFVTTKSCCECANTRKKQWNLDNAEHNKVVRSKYLKANPTWARDYSRRRYARDPGNFYFYAKLRKLSVKNRTPVWADLKLIRAVYKEAKNLREQGFDVVVDHEIPIHGELVSGLHVHNNLRIITNRENNAKSNFYEVNDYAV